MEHFESLPVLKVSRKCSSFSTKIEFRHFTRNGSQGITIATAIVFLKVGFLESLLQVDLLN